jgi:hypothetical protein
MLFHPSRGATQVATHHHLVSDARQKALHPKVKSYKALAPFINLSVQALQPILISHDTLQVTSSVK